MPAGTIVLTINSKTVTGSGTAFTTELKVNDFVVAVVGGVTYTLGVAAIASNTSLTLNTAFGGPTTSGLSWTAFPNQALVGITAQVASDTARAIRGLNYDKDNWQKIYSDVESVTVQRPDGSTFTGPSWGYMSAQLQVKADKTALNDLAKKGANSDITSLTGLTSALSIAQGGTGGTTTDAARANMQLGSRIFTLGSINNLLTYHNDRWPGGGIFPVRDDDGTTLGYRYGSGLLFRSADTYGYLVTSSNDGNTRLIAGTVSGGIAQTAYVNTLWGSRNTTVDTNNFIKRASPIARLTDNVSLMQPDFSVEGQQTVSGLVAVNAEAEGVSAEKSATGVYVVKGATGLAEEGWTLEVPQDINGNRLCFVKLDTDKNGVITVSVFKRRFDVESTMIVAGEPMDIPAGRWIDIRLQMPEDSVWNRRMKDMDNGLQEQEPTS